MNRSHRFHPLVAASVVLLGGCGDRPAAAAAPAHAATHVDSILPRAEALRRFQATARATDSLTSGAASRAELVAAFARALETRDTAALRRLALDRDEFAFLYYPTAPQGLPPYDLAPDLLWFMLQTASEKGLARALAARGGRPFGLRSHQCDPSPSSEGANRVWGPCALRHRVEGRLVDERLFGLIIERGGRYKFVSYGNRL